jgi:hypothetical protein
MKEAVMIIPGQKRTIADEGLVTDSERRES